MPEKNCAQPGAPLAEPSGGRARSVRARESVLPPSNLPRWGERDVSPRRTTRVRRDWPSYYRWTAGRPPRELLLRTLLHLEWEGGRRRRRLAVELGFGAGNDTLELLRRGWEVIGIDGDPAAAKFLSRRVPNRLRHRLSLRTAPMEGLILPKADLVYASYCLPFLIPADFPGVWEAIRRAVVPGGHFAGQLFGDRDEWAGTKSMVFHTLRQTRALTKGYRVDLFRESEEEGRTPKGRKHWHVFDLILEKPRSGGAGSIARRTID